MLRDEEFSDRRLLVTLEMGMCIKAENAAFDRNCKLLQLEFDTEFAGDQMSVIPFCGKHFFKFQGNYFSCSSGIVRAIPGMAAGG